MLTLDDIQAASLDIRWDVDILPCYNGRRQERTVYSFFDGKCVQAMVGEADGIANGPWRYSILRASQVSPVFATAEAAMRAAQGVLHALGRI